MTDSSAKNAEELPKNDENAPTIPEKIPEKSNEPPKKEAAAAPAAAVEEEEDAAAAAPAPKSRGRPRGSRDAAPRVKRVPVAAAAAETEEEEEAPAAAKRPPTRKAAPQKRAQVVAVEEEEAEAEAPVVEAEPPPPKSPRTLRRERMQALSNERRAMELARQARYDSILDNFMGY